MSSSAVRWTERPRAGLRAGMRRYAAALALGGAAGLLLAGCQRSAEAPPSTPVASSAAVPGAPSAANTAMSLQALSPRVHSFTTPDGPARNDYFTVDAPRRADPAFRSALRQAVQQAQAAAPGGLAVHSVYVYERGAKLNAQFQGSADELRGVHDEDLVAYARWKAGQADTFWIIERGQVVHDLLTDQPVKPPFEFD